MTEAIKYFHLCPVPLEVGSVIRPGNFGRIIRKAGWTHESAVREFAMEARRATTFPELPSRLACTFAFLSESEARVFQQQNHIFSIFHILYEVSLTNHDARSFVADWRLTLPQGRITENWSDAYWKGVTEAGTPVDNHAGLQTAGITCRELLTLSNLKIERVLD